MNPRVVHGIQRFLPRSETFINTLINAHRDYEASVLCQSRLNLDEFPFPRVDVHPKPLTKWKADWWLDASVDRATGRSLVAPRGRDDAGTRLQPAVVHAHFGPAGCELVDVTRAAGIPLVTSLYGVDAAVLPYLPHWRAAYRAAVPARANCFWPKARRCARRSSPPARPTDRTMIQPIAIELSKYPRWAPDGGADGAVRRTVRREKGLARRDRGIRARATACGRRCSS